MKRQTFDKHVLLHFPALQKRSAWKYADRGEDALQEAFVAIYREQIYKALPESLSSARVFGVICTYLGYAFLELSRRERDRLGLVRPLSYDEEGEDEGETPLYELQADVRKALGTLSLYHHGLVTANLIDEVPLREIALRTGETFYRVFTELEIAKACLRTELADYRGAGTIRY